MNRTVTKLWQFGEVPKEAFDRKIRCGVYVRVSTATELQDGSFQEQQEYYRNLISEDPELELAGIYADKRSGRSTEHRPEFKRMMQDARDGKMDMIFCKSVSRFGRNIADFTEATRELKQLGIRVVFIKDDHYHISQREQFDRVEKIRKMRLPRQGAVTYPFGDEFLKCPFCGTSLNRHHLPVVGSPWICENCNEFAIQHSDVYSAVFRAIQKREEFENVQSIEYIMLEKYRKRPPVLCSAASE